MKWIIILFIFIIPIDFKAQIRVKYDLNNGNFYKSNLLLKNDSVYLYFFGRKYLEYGKFRMNNSANQTFTLTKHNDNFFQYTSIPYFGKFINNFHLHNYSSFEKERIVLNLTGFNFQNSTAFNHRIAISNASYAKSNIEGYLDYVCEPFFELPDKSIYNIASDGISKMQVAIRLDPELNISDITTFQIGTEYVKFKQGSSIGGFIFLIFNEFIDITNPNGNTNTIILKFTDKFKFISGKKIQDLHTYKFEEMASGDILLSGRRISTANQNAVLLDKNLTFLKGLESIYEFDLLFRSDPTNSIYGFEKSTNKNCDYFVKSISRNNYSILTKMDSSYKIKWQKVIPETLDFIPDDAGGGTAIVNKTGLSSNFLDIYYLDSEGNSNPGFKDFCGKTFESSLFYKNRISSFSDIINLKYNQYEINSWTIPTAIQSITTESVPGTFIKPEPDFSINDTICLNACDTIVTKDVGIIDSSYYIIKNNLAEKIICPDSIGSFLITHYIEYFGGCIDSVEKLVYVSDVPEVSMLANAIICDENVGVEITADVKSGSEISWTDDRHNDQSVRIIRSKGDYTITASYGVCKDSSTINIALISDLYPDWPRLILPAESEICLGSQQTLSVNAPELLDNFVWSDGSHQSSISVADSGYIFLNAGLEGCLALDSFLVKVIDCRDGNVYIPNVFSPNHDNMNDLFRIETYNATVDELRIFSRWGELVYSEKPYTGTGWDGTYKNKEITPDVFIYFVKIRHTLSGREEIKKGDITVVR